MRSSLNIAGMALLAGCSVEQRAENGTTADINAAAAAAQGDIDTYAAGALEPELPKPAATPPPAMPTPKRALVAAAAPDPTPTGQADPQPTAIAAEASYRCSGETRVSVRFDNDADTATIRREGRDVAVLKGQRPASGIWYKGGGYELRGKGEEAEYTAPGGTPVACSTEMKVNQAVQAEPAPPPGGS